MQIAFYYTTRLYHPILAGSGWESVADEVATTFKQGEYQKMAAAVPDEMVDAIALAGTREQVQTKINDWRQFSDHVLLYSPSIGLGRSRLMENMESIVDCFGN